METTRVLPLRFDAQDPEVRENPYPTYARLREAGPLCRFGPGSWGVTRHEDVLALQRDPRLGSAFPEEYHRMATGGGPASDFFARIVLYRDPPEHRRLRHLLGRAFTPAASRAIRGHVGRLVDGLLDGPARAGGLDVVTDLAYPLPVLVVCHLMGIPAQLTDDVRRRATDLGRAFSAVVPAETRVAADAAVVWLRGYVGGLLEQRAADPGDDLLSQLLAAGEDGDSLSHDEIVDNIVFSLFAGFETTVHLIASGCAALLADPGQQALVREDRSLVPGAVEEFLRLDAPVQGTARMVREPVRIGDRTIRAGRVLVLLLGSANHDERVFAGPDRLDVTRQPNPHVTFGGGPHLCLGAYLARLEAAVVFEQLLERFTRLQPAGVPVRQLDTPFRAWATVPMAVGTG